MSGEKVATYLRTHVPTDGRTDAPTLRPTDARPSRAFEEHEFVAMAWQQLSKYPQERAIAASRWKRFGQRLDPELGLYALCEVAFGGYHAYMFTERVARERQAKLREVIAELDKSAQELSAAEFAAFMRSLR